jgi:hypothetical protein
MDFLTPVLGETGARVVIIALVLLLLGAMVMLLIGTTMRAFGGRFSFFRRSGGRAPRLAVPDTLAVDSRRKLVLVRRDNVEHLLLVGGSTDLVIEPAIQRYTANNRARPSTAARPEAAAPQPAATPTASSSGTARPLAARSQQAIQAGYPQGTEPRSATLPRAGLETGAPGTGTRAAELRPNQTGPGKGAATAPAKADRPRPAASEKPAAERAAPVAQNKDEASAAPAKSAPLHQTAAQPASADRPNQAAAPQAAPTKQSRPSDQAATARPQPAGGASASADPNRLRAGATDAPIPARPTAAAQPPPGHPSAPRRAEPQTRQVAGEGPTQPLPRAGNAERAAAEKRPNPAESDPDMTALLGEIFGQNKH